jgi:hypothetical protein
VNKAGREYIYSAHQGRIKRKRSKIFGHLINKNNISGKHGNGKGKNYEIDERINREWN